MGSLPRAAADTAARQRAVITRGQLLGTGIDDRSVDRLVGGGVLQPMHPSVYRVAGAPSDWHQMQMAACLAAGPGAVASHRAAARLWRLVDAHAVVEVTVPRERAPQLAGVTLHRSTDLAPDHITTRDDIPVTNPLRVMIDLGAVCPVWTVEDALDRGLVDNLFGVPAVEWMLNELGRRGRRGAGVIRRVLDGRALGDARPDGLLEPRMARLLNEAGLPPPAFQHEVRTSSGQLVGRVDFAYVERRLAIEVDGHRAHATPAALQRDLERQNRLTELGWTVLRFTWHDVVRRPAAVATTIRSVLGNFYDR